MEGVDAQLWDALELLMRDEALHVQAHSQSQATSKAHEIHENSVNQWLPKEQELQLYYLPASIQLPESFVQALNLGLRNCKDKQQVECHKGMKLAHGREVSVGAQHSHVAAV